MSNYMQKEVSKITDQVWIGSAPPRDEKLYEKFDIVVLAAEEYQPPSNYWENIEIVYAPLDDSGEPITNSEKKIAVSTAIFIAKRIKKGKRVLFTCKMGLNRSTFIAALSILYAGIEFNPSRVISKMRKARGSFAFSNSEFEHFFRQESYRLSTELQYY